MGVLGVPACLGPDVKVSGLLISILRGTSMSVNMLRLGGGLAGRERPL